MAAASLAKPGSEHGPCLTKCSHTDCASTRGLAAQECVWCGVEIGYDFRFFNVTPDGEPAWSRLAHMHCELLGAEGYRACVRCTRLGSTNRATKHRCPGDGGDHHHGRVHVKGGKQEAVCDIHIDEVWMEWNPSLTLAQKR